MALQALSRSAPSQPYPTEEEEKGDAPRGRTTPIASIDVPDIVEQRNSSSWRQRLCSVVDKAFETFNISSAAKQCIKELKSLPSTSHSAFLKDCEIKILTRWMNKASMEHSVDFHLPKHEYDSSCPFEQECSAFKAFYLKDLRVITKHSSIPGLIDGSSFPLKEKIEIEAATVQCLYQAGVEAAFIHYSPQNQGAIHQEHSLRLMSSKPKAVQKPDFNMRMFANYQALEDLLNGLKNYPQKNPNISELHAKTLVAVADCVLDRLTSQTYTGRAKMNQLDLDAQSPLLAREIRAFHPFIMKKLAQFAHELVGHEVPALASMSFIDWQCFVKRFS